MNSREIIKLYQGGSYGTPKAPIRSSSPKAKFWAGYFSHQAPAKNSVNRAAYDAGAIVRKREQQTCNRNHR